MEGCKALRPSSQGGSDPRALHSTRPPSPLVPGRWLRCRHSRGHFRRPPPFPQRGWQGRFRAPSALDSLHHPAGEERCPGPPVHRVGSSVPFRPGHHQMGRWVETPVHGEQQGRAVQSELAGAPRASRDQLVPPIGPEPLAGQLMQPGAHQRRDPVPRRRRSILHRLGPGG